MTIAQTAASYYRSLDFDELDRGCGSMSSIALALQLRSDRIFFVGAIDLRSNLGILGLGTV
ncbi:MAG: hypothetical protein HC941_17045 [Microcoleus sp. SU_5_3]|nr:hypothetical protein [Microcoleus sp. SU_5_3]